MFHLQKKVTQESTEPQCRDHGPQAVPNYSYCFRAIINDGTTTTSLTCLSPEAHTFIQDCNEAHQGKNVRIGKDDTIFSLIDGLVKFEKFGPDRKKVSVNPREVQPENPNSYKNRKTESYNVNAERGDYNLKFQINSIFVQSLKVWLLEEVCLRYILAELLLLGSLQLGWERLLRAFMITPNFLMSSQDFSKMLHLLHVYTMPPFLVKPLLDVR
nr:50S ribosomal protein L27, chloroplastic [Tanacetum cinerariifolium]